MNPALHMLHTGRGDERRQIKWPDFCFLLMKIRKSGGIDAGGF
jgi:hypothetical protein